MHSLNGKVAVVTGAGGERGVGRAIAMRPVQEGVHVVVNDIHGGSPPGSAWGGLLRQAW